MFCIFCLIAVAVDLRCRLFHFAKTFAYSPFLF